MDLTPEAWSALSLSLQVGLWCVLATLLPAVGVAWLLARKDFRGKVVVDAIVHLPLVLPPVVTGWLLLVTFGRRGWLSEPLGLDLAFSFPGAVLAAAIVGFPLSVRAIRLAFELVDPRLAEAALLLGAPPWRAWITVTLPLALPGVLTGMLLAFARSLGEFGATITFAGNIADQTRTLPLAVFSATQRPGGEDLALTLVVLSVLLSFGALVASELLARRVRRKLGR